MLDPRPIGFRKLAMADLPLLHRWLNETPIVKEIYAHGKETPYDEVVAKYGAYIGGEKPTTPYLILYGQTPIGYIQVYRWADYAFYWQPFPEYAWVLAENAAGVDLYIGEEAYLHQGLGRHLLRAFFREVLFADPDVQSCVITPDAQNAGAIRAYEKAGMTAHTVLNHPDEPTPVLVLRIGREEAGA